ncbi:MAG: asparagine synthase (glutamine-hydrolyzing) [Oscillospiraceae bacterium]|nr:asparagine synthase (glutamine-hydrolyzing) [Oscillospiraceae bacterium]
MCGIAGFVGLKSDRNTRECMLQSMIHRGPDGYGEYLNKDCCLLHTRLAIVDPEGGKQPMRLGLKKENYTIVYNGELYNTEELRDLLTKLGHKFDGHSDTEVVLHAYAQWEEKCVEKFNGIFAFAIWEEKCGKLFVARDRIGVKPLFYKLHNHGFLFASEIKTILRYPTVKAELDADGIAQVLLLGPGRVPGSGVLKDIFELEPGCYGYFYAGRWHWKRYWKLRDREHQDSFEETAECVRWLVTDAIKRQMVSDVPIGTFLSGGLDSSIISAVCGSELAEQGIQLPTFSLDYSNNEKYFTPGKFQPESDNDYIQIMQNFLNSNKKWTVLNTEELAETLNASMIARDLPGMADIDSSLYLFCREIVKDVKVALSGECADEIFGGYPWYRDPEVRNAEGFPWAQNTRERTAFVSPYLAEKIDARSFVNDHYQATISQCDILPDTSPEERRVKEMVNLNQRWFMQTLLDRKDRMSMHHGLEVRVPFCDYRIAEYLYAVPWEYKDYQGREKGLLRYAMTGILPDAVLYRKKSPYPKTYDPRYLNTVSQMLRDVLDDADAPILQIVDRGALESLISAEYAWPWYGQLMKTPQTIAYMLQINCWLEHYKISVV